MNFDAMSLMCIFIGQHFPTGFTLDLEFALVDVEMGSEVCLEIKRLSTHVTSVGFCAHVLPDDVSLQGQPVHKGFPALVTFLRFFSRVGADVPKQKKYELSW